MSSSQRKITVGLSVAAVLACCVTVALGANIALAAQGVGEIGGFGEGDVKTAFGVGVDQTAHNVYFANRFYLSPSFEELGGNLYEFAPPAGSPPNITTGEHLVQFGGACTSACPPPGNGFFSAPEGGLAIDSNTTPSTLFAFDGGDGLIQQFTLNSSATATTAPVFVSQFSVGISTSPVDIAVDKNSVVYFPNFSANEIQEFTATGAPGPVPVVNGTAELGQQGSGTANNALHGPTNVAVDANGNPYVVDTDPETGKRRVEEFNSAGVFQKVLDSGNQSDAVAVDPSNNNVWVVDSQVDGQEYVNVYDAAGSLLAGSTASSFTPEGLRSIRQIAVDGTTHNAYVAASGLARIEVLGIGPVPAGATTGVASNLTATTATVSGSVDPGGNTSQYYFEYSKESAECTGGSQTSPQPAGSGSGNVPETAPLTGLQPNTPYAFCILAATPYGSVTGAPVKFTTTALPPTITAQPASETTQSSVRLNALINPNHQETTCEFQYGETTAYGKEVPCEPATLEAYEDQPVSVEIAGLAKNTIYHYRVVTVNPPGTTLPGTTYGQDQAVTTLPEAPAVTTGQAAGVTATSATLAGTVNAQGAQTSYQFEYGISTAYGSQVRADAGVGTSAIPVALAVSGLNPATTYHFRVLATNADATTYGADQTFTTPPVPPAATTGAAQFVNDTGALLGGTIDPQGTDTTYQFEYGTGISYGLSAPPAPTDAGASAGVQGVSVSIAGLASGTTYHYRLEATNAAGTTYGQDMTFTTTGAPQTSTFAGFTVPTVPQIAMPPLAFPTETGTTSNPPPRVLTRAQKLAKALKACAKKSRKHRAACIKQARRQYGRVIKH